MVAYTEWKDAEWNYVCYRFKTFSISIFSERYVTNRFIEILNTESKQEAVDETDN